MDYELLAGIMTAALANLDGDTLLADAIYRSMTRKCSAFCLTKRVNQLSSLHV